MQEPVTTLVSSHSSSSTDPGLSSSPPPAPSQVLAFLARLPLHMLHHLAPGDLIPQVFQELSALLKTEQLLVVSRTEGGPLTVLHHHGLHLVREDKLSLWLPDIAASHTRLPPVPKGAQYLSSLETCQDRMLQSVAGPVEALAIVPFSPGNDSQALLVAVRSLPPASWSVQDQMLLEAMASTIALMYQRVNRLTRLEISLTHSEALLQITRLSEEELEAQEVASRAIEYLNRAISTDWIGLWVVSGDRATPKSLHVSPDVPPPLLAALALGSSREAHPLWMAIETSAPVFETDRDRLVSTANLDALPFAAAAYVPIVQRSGQCELLLHAVRLSDSSPWTELECQLFEATARSIRVAADRRRKLDDIIQAAFTDALTGTGNRRAFDQDLEMLLSSARRHNFPVTLAMFDLDGLKQVNDREGHATGDRLLQTFARALRGTLRQEDRLYRLGGDEFAGIFSHTDAPRIQALIRRLPAVVAWVRARGFMEADISYGLAHSPIDADTAAGLCELADSRMYEMKQVHRTLRKEQSRIIMGPEIDPFAGPLSIPDPNDPHR